ncbi:MAG: Ref family recombination enhancement nuclease [Mizugakiibacter sp.]|uniref:Ref family recombination enhancement nuclease n=1 Tax=Mizugakiibacter sp. TaxID=1972610 RepID=UPI00320F0290
MKGTNPTKGEKLYWSRLVSAIGCIACRLDGITNNHCSIHHIDGRTKPGAHMNVLPLCAGHHQDGTDGTDKIAVHPWKARFEARYGKQEYLKAKCDAILDQQGWND